MLKKITDSLLILFSHISPHKNCPRNQPITKITVHHNAGNIGIRALAEWLARITTRASYNYGISSLGEVAQFVYERCRSWASSSRDNDNAAVTIGVANNRLAPHWTVSAAAWNKLVELCVDICCRNPGIVQQDGTRGLWYDGTPRGSLTTHDMFARTICPGPYLKARMPELCKVVNRRLAEKLEEENLSPEKFDELMKNWLADRGELPPSPWAEKELEYAKAAKITDGTRPRSFVTREEAAIMALRSKSPQ